MNTNFLIQVKRLCEKRCIRLTPQRLAVLQLISQYNKAISAYDLLNLLRQSSSPHAKPSTIYRVLNFLLKQKFIHRIESTNQFMPCHYSFELSHNFIFFICNHCHHVNEQNIPDIEKTLKNTAAKKGFIIYNNVVEIHGMCVKCININTHKSTNKL